MGRIFIQYNLASKDARRRLHVRKYPYWSMTMYCRHVGYHKPTKKGVSWVARIRLKNGSYRQHFLGLADDFRAANGDTVLAYGEAWAAALKWFARYEQVHVGAEPGRMGINQELLVCPIGNEFTVGHALVDYVEWKRLASAKSNFGTVLSLINYHIVPRLASIPVSAFGVEDVTRFVRHILETPPKRGQQPLGPKVSIESLDPTALQRRKKTVNVVLSLLRGALYMAWQNGKVESERAWRCIRRFKNVDVSRSLFLSRAECKLLLQKCRPDLRRLVLAALYTGCRVTELLSMNCSHVGRDGYGVYVSALKAHCPRFVFLPDEGMAWFLQLIKGRDVASPLFLSDKTGRAFGKYKHLFSAAVREAGLPVEFGFHGLRHTYASQLVQAGAPVMVVSEQLGHTNAMTVLRTYGHLSPQIRESEVRQRFTTLSAEIVQKARKESAKLRSWRKSLHGSNWRTYAKINETGIRGTNNLLE